MSKLEVINRLIGSDIPLGYPINVFGKPMAGKTLLTLQLAFQYSSPDKDIMILDVDGGADIFLKEWEPIFRKRYGHKGKVIIEPAWNEKTVAPNQKNVYFDMRIFSILGIKAKVVISSSGKSEFIPHSICPDKLEGYMKGGKIGAIIIDSFSQVFKDCFIGTQSFADRARAEDMLFSLLKTIGAKYGDILIFCNHHQSANPMTGKVDIAGGSAVIQNSKLAFYIDRVGVGGQDFAKLWIYRYPTIPSWRKKAIMKFTEEGFVDSDESELERAQSQ